jgi:branched-chain amino acid aminotransferase
MSTIIAQSALRRCGALTSGIQRNFLLSSGLDDVVQNRKCSRTAAVTGSFKFADLEIKECPKQLRRPQPDPNNLVFGAHYSDHMFEVEYREDRGWGKPLICPIHDLILHPGAKVLHYAVEVFEGMKAYRGYDGKIRIFRPNLNMNRMLASSRRSALPDFDVNELQKCIEKLVSIDREWVPKSTSSTLYIRPTFIGTEPTLGVSQSKTALLYVLTGPVGPYFPTGFKPVSLLADPSFVRACKGGSGNYKMGANYAPTISVQMEAVKKYNCQQVLWLYGPDHEVTEVGTMNFFAFWTNEAGERELATPPLSTGLILPGVTRQSLLDLSRQWGEFKVVERQIYMKDIVKALEEKRLHELFGAGTACVVCPIESILYDGRKLEIPTMANNAPITMRLHRELTDIQFGKTASDWMVVIE